MSNIINSYRFGTAAAGYDFGNALTFDGTDDYITTGLTNNPLVWTFSTWFKVNTVSVTSAFGGDSAAVRFVGQVTSATTINVRGTSTGTFTVPTISTGTWYHVMISTTGGNTRVYLNAVESSSGALATGGGIKYDSIGMRSSANYFNGILDELIYEDGTAYGLSDAQSLYNSGNGVASDSIITGSDIYYKFNESGTTTTATDSSGSGNDGTLTNFPSSGMWNAH